MFKLFLLTVGFCATAINAAFPSASIDRPNYHVDILRLNPDTDELVHICDGAILDSHHLITAAHCVHDESPKELLVRSGSDVAPPPTMPYVEMRLYHKVTKIMYPKDFVYTACRHHEHDVAILKVNRAFDLAFDKLFKQVDLPEPDNDFEGYMVTLSGYTDQTLTTLDVKVISNEECSTQSTSIVTRGNLCGKVGENATKLAISGSPLVHENILVGIMNASPSCENTENLKVPCIDQPADLKLYTRIGNYLNFIQKVLNRQASADIVYKS